AEGRLNRQRDTAGPVQWGKLQQWDLDGGSLRHEFVDRYARRHPAHQHGWKPELQLWRPYASNTQSYGECWRQDRGRRSSLATAHYQQQLTESHHVGAAVQWR